MRSIPSCWNKTLVQLGFKRKRRQSNRGKERHVRRSLFESLEARQMLAITVDSTSNEILENGEVTLLEAVLVANGSLVTTDATGTAGLDTINFDLPANSEIVLQSQLSILEDLILEGPGTDSLTIRGSGTQRAFYVNTGIDATLSGLTITGGNATGSGAAGDGGGIYHAGDLLTLESVELYDNRADYNGGGLYADTGSSVAISNSIFDLNSAKYGGGALIRSNGSNEISVTESTFSSNTADVSGVGSGGGLYIWGGNNAPTAEITNTTFSGNYAAQFTGGLRAQNGGTILVVNSTITNNSAGVWAGGVSAYGSPTHSILEIHNTILADNHDPDNNTSYDDADGHIDASSSYNLVGVTNSSTLQDETTNKNVVIGTAEPLLSELSDYGGGTPMHALLPDSLAIGAGSNAEAAAVGLTVDQRGTGYNRVNGSLVDIGAHEANVVQLASDDSVIVYGSDLPDNIAVSADNLSASWPYGVAVINSRVFTFTRTPSSITVFAGDDIDNLTNFTSSSTAPVVLNGEGGDDFLQGGILEDQLFGGAGNDRLTGSLGNDLLDGGTGQDDLIGGDGDDTYQDHGLDGEQDVITGGPGIDTPDEVAISGADTGITSAPYTLQLNWPAGGAAIGTVHWGDGSSTQVTDADTSVNHTFLSYGALEISFEAELAGDIITSVPISVAVMTDQPVSPVITNVFFDFTNNSPDIYRDFLESVHWDNFTTGAVTFELEQSPNGLDSWTSVTTSALTEVKVRHAHDPFYYRVRTIKEIGGIDEYSDWSDPRRRVANDLAVDFEVVPQGITSEVVLSWNNEFLVDQDPSATTYTISRRIRGESAWGDPVMSATADAMGLSWTDVVASDVIYEYRVVRSGPAIGSGEFLVATGIDASVQEDRGSVVLLVDDRFNVTLSLELARLEQDLIGDGWNVIRQNVDVSDPNTTVESLRQDVIGYYDSHEGLSSEVKSVLLLGRIPIPKSGWVDPGGHGRLDAVSADAFYGDIDGIWTDSTVNAFTSKIGGILESSNRPGDGKYDQSTVPADGDGAAQELAVGRIDMRGMALEDPNSSYTGDGAWQSYTIEVGKTFTGSFDSLAFVVGDVDVQGGAVLGSGEFRNLVINDGTTPTPIDFDSLIYSEGRVEHATRRVALNNASIATIEANVTASTLTAHVDKNNWLVAKQDIGGDGTTDPFVITEDTVLTFEFRSDSGNVPDNVAIGFDRDDTFFDPENTAGLETFDEDFLFRVNSIGIATSMWGQAVDTSVEYDLIRRYLDKDHAYRHGLVEVENRVIVDDVLTPTTSLDNAFSMFDADDLSRVWTNNNAIDETSALWAFGGASGSAYYIGGDKGDPPNNRAQAIATELLLEATSNAVFTTTLSSFSHEWDRADGVLRSILADEGLGLTAMYSGFADNRDFRSMGIGSTIGDAYVETQDRSSGDGHVYRSILGDPTLRLHVLDAPSNVVVQTATASEVQVTWDASPEDTNNGGILDAGYGGEFLGYHVYKAASLSGPFTKVTDTSGEDLFSGTSAVVVGDSTSVYMVRAVKLESGNSGVYTNLSQGVFAEGDSLAPQVINVTISGSSSLHAPYSFDAVDGTGAQLKTVPVGGADTIAITFDEPVQVSSGDLEVVGLRTAFVPALAQFNYDSQTNTAAWQFSALPANDQFVISLPDSVTDLAGNNLDGEWINPSGTGTTNPLVSEFPSGDGTAGGNFDFVVTLLAGDADLDNLITGLDFFIWQVNAGGSNKTFAEGDFDGDGDVDSADSSLLWSNYGASMRSISILADLDGDNDVDDDDFNVVNGNLGMMSGATYADGDLDGDEDVDQDDLDLLFAQLGTDLELVS